MPEKNAAIPEKKTTWALVLAVVLAGVCICSLVGAVGGYFLFRDRLVSRQIDENRVGLSVDRRSRDGVTQGAYRYPSVLGGRQVNFTVSEGGTATFLIDGAPEDQTLTVDLVDERNATINWGGVTLDGMGELTPTEQRAFSDLMENELVHGLKYIPLDAACQGEEVVTSKQLAALLVPLQMRFKYLIEDRVSEAKQLMKLTRCAYGNPADSIPVDPALIKLSASQPVPVVIGFFPFDGDGALEAPVSFGPGAKNACQPVLPMSTANGQPVNLTGEGVTRDEYGPCEAMCRGACGADCEPNNCRVSSELRCEKDDHGDNTGNDLLVISYDCGLHAGCIEHDACYDRCNERYGCGSWGAAFCRHGWSPDMVTTFVLGMFCDQSAIQAYGTADPILWMNGFGPMSERRTFEYIDRDYSRMPNIELCPAEKMEESGEKQPQEQKPEESGEKQPQEEKEQIVYEWVLSTVEVNPNNAKESYQGGGITPYWFTEARFEGKSVTYTATDSSFAIHDVDVDHGYMYRDVTIQVDFDAPPLILERGTREELSVSFSHSGSVYEGGSGIFMQFWYSSEDVSIELVGFFTYAPWREDFGGSSSTTYVLNVPYGDVGDEFTVYASLINAEPCIARWTYRLQEAQ